MEPMSALAVATSVVQFVDFSYKCLVGFIEVYQSIDSDGGPAVFEQLFVTGQRLQASNVRLKASFDPGTSGRQITDSEKEILVVAEECLDVAMALQEIKESLKSDNSISSWKRAKTSVKAIRKRKKLDNLQQKLHDLRDHLIFVVVLSLRDDIKEFATQLSVNQSQRDAIWGESMSIGKEILDQVSSMKLWHSNLGMALDDLEIPDEIPQAENTRDLIQRSSWPETELAQSVFSRLLRHLTFSEITSREERVAEAHRETFDWIFLQPRNQRSTTWHNFAEWLGSDASLYWIIGKAGSGKSTLMKHILQNHRTEEHLLVWGNGTPVITASFYFWLAGSVNLQHSQEGLLRTLLAQGLSRLRDIAPQATIARWNSFALSRDFSAEWTWDGLQQMFRLLLEDSEHAVKYCFFIDGLDEFKGDHSSLVSFILKVSQYPNVKLCVASRPWIIFEDELLSKPQLRLEDLTYSDIKTYIHSELGSSVAFRELRMIDESEAEALVENIAEKSAGVFLWVVLVVRSLKKGLRDGDRLPDVQKRLDALPPELDDLFRSILHGFNGRYMQEASALFQIIKASPVPLSLLSLSLADEDPNLAIHARIDPVLSSPAQRFYRALNMRRRLDSRCKGLLEVGPVIITAALTRLSKKEPSSDDDEISMAPNSDSHPEAAVNTETPPRDQAPEYGRDTTEILRDLSQLPPEQGDLLADAEIGYLHRTVKDFLDQPEIWEQITSATDEDFAPYLALARSYLLQLKWVHNCRGYSSADVPEAVWNAIFSALGILREMQSLGINFDTDLLDELGRVILPLLPSIRRYGDPGPRIEWPIDRPPLDFLHLTAKFGFHRYINERLRLTRADDTYIVSVLDYLVPRADEFVSTLRSTPSFHFSGPDMATVKTLLSHTRLSKRTKKGWVKEFEQVSNTYPENATPTRPRPLVVPSKVPPADDNKSKGGSRNRRDLSGSKKQMMISVTKRLLHRE